METELSEDDRTNREPHIVSEIDGLFGYCKTHEASPDVCAKLTKVGNGTIICRRYSEESPCAPYVLDQIVQNRSSMPCQICGTVCDPCVAFSCSSSHILCLECFIAYSNFVISEPFDIRPNSTTLISCPCGCPNGEIHDPHHFYLLGPERYEKFKERAAEAAFVRDGGIFCPVPSCGAAFVLEPQGLPEATTEVSCPSGHRICGRCRDTAHSGSCFSLPVDSSGPGFWGILERMREIVKARTCIDSLTKRCPNCQVPIEKNEGCMHMFCTKCGFEFCWMCLKKWSEFCLQTHWFG